MTYRIERNGVEIETAATLPYRDNLGEGVEATYRLWDNDGPGVWSAPATMTSLIGTPPAPNLTAGIGYIDVEAGT